MADFVETKVREIIAEQLGLGDDDVQIDASIAGDLGADALDFIELVMAFEDEFEVDIDDDEAEGFVTVKDVTDYFARRTQ